MRRSELLDIIADSPGLTKSELISYLARSTGLTKVETEAVIEGMLGTVQDALELGKKVELRGFGTFYVKTREPREARNPATQEKVMLNRRRVPIFKPSRTLKQKIDQAKDA
ncbi:MAG: integration host factor subunit beta [Candidatus Marinimicrobia bacterium]|nr:integration host factor subunit beta [Candidatus Neomarinimicrobiota bacterium]